MTTSLLSFLKMMSHDGGRRVVHLWKELGFEMCGQRVDAKTDIFVMERSGTTSVRYLLLVQENNVRKPHLCVSKICSHALATRSNGHLSRDDPEPQLTSKR